MLAAPVKKLLQKFGFYYWLFDRYVEFRGIPLCRGWGYFGRKYLRGEGLEIGALHFPQIVRSGTTVRYVDRLSHEELVARYPELEPNSIVRPSVIDNGFELSKVTACSQDFVVANHVLEHSPNPLQTLKNWARLIRDSGHILISVPIAERCFDQGRAPTSVEHFYEDYKLCLDGNMDDFHARNMAHYKEWVSISDPVVRKEQGKPPMSAQEQEQFSQALSQDKAEIHFHTFSYQSFLDFLELFIERICGDFTICTTGERGIELVAVLQRTRPCFKEPSSS